MGLIRLCMRWIGDAVRKKLIKAGERGRWGSGRSRGPVVTAKWVRAIHPNETSWVYNLWRWQSDFLAPSSLPRCPHVLRRSTVDLTVLDSRERKRKRGLDDRGGVQAWWRGVSTNEWNFSEKS